LRTTELNDQNEFVCFVWILKKGLFSYTALTDWFLQPKGCVFTAACKGYL